MQHFDICPHCGELQSKSLTKTQGYVKLEEDESNSIDTTLKLKRNVSER